MPRCFSQLSGKLPRRPSSVRSGGWRPSTIAWTISGARNALGKMRLIYRSSRSVAPARMTKRDAIHVESGETFGVREASKAHQPRSAKSEGKYEQA